MRIEDILKSLGVETSPVISRCSHIVLFGSRAAGCELRNSDWDLLCVLGEGEVPCKIGIDPRIDLVWKTEAEVNSKKWLSGELAGHIAHYGRPLKGEPDWFSAVCSSAQAINEKVRRIRRLTGALADHWPELRREYQIKYAIKVRRDLQRLWLLEQGVPVPPSRMLDDKWRETPEELQVGIRGSVDRFDLYSALEFSEVDRSTGRA